MKQSPNRRTFLKHSVALGGAAMLAPFSRQASARPDIRQADDSQIVGQGDHRFRVHKEWGIQDPNRVPINNCHEMVQDASGRLLLLTDHPANNMIIYNKDGKVVDTWTLDLIGAHGLTIANEGEEQVLFVTDSEMNRVIKTNLAGEVLMEVEAPLDHEGYGALSDWKPTEVAVLENGAFFVADGYGQNFITHYSHNGEILNVFGGKGEGDAQFDCCHGVTLDTREGKDPALLITSRSHQAFKRFSLEGEHLETIPLPGCWICRPVIRHNLLHFAVIVTESWWHYDGMVAILDQDNAPLSFPGGSIPGESGENLNPIYDGTTFLNPHDVCVDEDGNLFVPQWYSGKTYPVMLERI